MKKFLLMFALLLSIVGLSACEDDAPNVETPDNTQTPPLTYEDAPITRYESVYIFETGEKLTQETREDEVQAGLDIKITAVNKKATIYMMVVSNESKAPSNFQLQAGKDYDNVKVLAHYTGQNGVLEDVKYDDIYEQGAKLDVYVTIFAEDYFSDHMYKTTVYTYHEHDLLFKGTGTLADPYLVYTVQDLIDFNNRGGTAHNSHYKMMANVDMSTVFGEGMESWVPFGTISGKQRAYTGTFDGNGFTINGLYVRSNVEGSGFISLLSGNGTLKNVTFTNADCVGQMQRSAIACGYHLGTIENVHILASTVGGTRRLGAISGQMFEAGSVTNCYVEADVVSSSDALDSGDVGGIVGATYRKNAATKDAYLTIDNCQFSGTVSGPDNVGGILGYAEGTIITNSVVTNSTLTGITSVGSIVGSDPIWNSRIVYVDNAFAYNNQIIASSGVAGPIIGNKDNNISYDRKWSTDLAVNAGYSGEVNLIKVTNAYYMNVEVHADTLVKDITTSNPDSNFNDISIVEITSLAELKSTLYNVEDFINEFTIVADLPVLTSYKNFGNESEGV